MTRGRGGRRNQKKTDPKSSVNKSKFRKTISSDDSDQNSPTKVDVNRATSPNDELTLADEPISPKASKATENNNLVSKQKTITYCLT